MCFGFLVAGDSQDWSTTSKDKGVRKGKGHFAALLLKSFNEQYCCPIVAKIASLLTSYTSQSQILHFAFSKLSQPVMES